MAALLSKRPAGAPKLRLVVRDGRRIDRVPASGAPETVLDVSFVGLTEAEQYSALAAFPGGRRFRLVGAGR